MSISILTSSQQSAIRDLSPQLNRLRIQRGRQKGESWENTKKREFINRFSRKHQKTEYLITKARKTKNKKNGFLDADVADLRRLLAGIAWAPATRGSQCCHIGRYGDPSG